VLARALGTLDLPPYASLDEFCAALTRFAGPDPVATARGLFRRWEERQVPAPAVAAPELTISDIRRARRATGWSLDDLSAVADVPAARLRELEWGYVRNWRADEDARNRVRRYARAAGLDEALVLSIAWPLIENGVTAAVIDEDEPAPVTALVRSGPQTIARIEPPAGRRARSGLVSSVLAIAVAALVALATFAIVMGSNPQSPNRHSQAPNPNAQTSNRSSQMPVPNSQRTVTARAVRPVPSAAIAARAPNSRPAAGPRKRPAPQPRQAARPRSFFKKLFRIGIK
jgi:negative regulator of sigma E activity